MTFFLTFFLHLFILVILTLTSTTASVIEMSKIQVTGAKPLNKKFKNNAVIQLATPLLVVQTDGTVADQVKIPLNQKNKAIIVKLKDSAMLTQLITTLEINENGLNDYAGRLKTFTMQWSKDGVTWQPYLSTSNSGATRIFDHGTKGSNGKCSAITQR